MAGLILYFRLIFIFFLWVAICNPHFYASVVYAVYTFTSGIESESVGQYTNYLLSSLATRTIGSFTKRTARGLFEFISSEERRTYAYYPAVVDLYTEIDFGNILYTPQPVIATDTVQVDDLNATLSNTILSDSGTGTGTTGGFNIGRHIRFNSTNKPRW